jgi:flagellar biosynthesis/type III secretory pathway protein FliH
LSEPRLTRSDGERTARVWQASDFFQLGPDGGFVAKRWRDDAAMRFEPTESPTVVRPAHNLTEPRPELPAPGDLLVPAAAESALPEPATEVAGLVNEEALENARKQAYAEGQEDGREEARRQMQQTRQAEDRLIGDRIAALQASLDAFRLEPEHIHEPLKRLALHLAEQLVLGELSQSPQAIDRLVRRCVDELGNPPPAPLRIELHPDDLALLQPWLASQAGEDTPTADAKRAAPAWHWVANESLRPGSVRASANDAVVNDLIEHRLDALARQLLPDGRRAAQQSAFQPERLAARRADVDAVLDAQPRMADLPRQNRFSPVVEAESTPAPPSMADAPLAGQEPAADEEPAP